MGMGTFPPGGIGWKVADLRGLHTFLRKLPVWGQRVTARGGTKKGGRWGAGRLAVTKGWGYWPQGPVASPWAMWISRAFGRTFSVRDSSPVEPGGVWQMVVNS